MSRKYGRGSDGKFTPGNPGKPQGARNKTSLAAEELLDGQAERVTQKAVDMALEGHPVALKLCLERILPARKHRAVNFQLPETMGAIGACEAARAVLEATSVGNLTPTEAASIMQVVVGYQRSVEDAEIEARIAALEERLLEASET